MPTYEYECSKCEATFEAFQSIKDAPLTQCPTCKGKVTRLIGSGAGILFKGSGFYQTDYRSKSYTESAKKDSGSSSKTSETRKASSGACSSGCASPKKPT